MSAPGSAPRTRVATMLTGDRGHLALLLALSAVVLGALAVLHDQFVLLSGDEPHYLVISQTLARYRSLDVQRVYDHGDYAAFYPAFLPPHIAHGPGGRPLPRHGIGGPVLWLLPFVVAGRPGVLAFMTATTSRPR